MYKLIATAIAVFAVALLVLGCGNDGGEATAQVSKPQFMKQARTICANTQSEVRALLIGKERPANDSVDPYGKLAPLLKREAEGLEAISGPEKVEVQIEPLIENILRVSQIVAEEGEKAATDRRISEYKGEAFDLGLRNC